MLKFFIIALLYFAISSVHTKDDIKKIKEQLSQGGKFKEHSVHVVTEHGHTSKSDANNKDADTSKDKKSATIKTGQKAAGHDKVTTGKNLDQTKKAEKDSKKKVTSSPQDIKDKASHATKVNTKKAVKEAEKLSKQQDKIKHTENDKIESIKSTAQLLETQAEKGSDGFVDKIFHMFTDVKNSLLEPASLSSKDDADVTDRVPSKSDEVPDSLRKTGAKAKKKIKDTTDL